MRVAVELLGGVAGEVAIRRAGGVWRSSGRDVQNAPLAPYVEASNGALWIADWHDDPRIDPALVADDVKQLTLLRRRADPAGGRRACWGCCR